MRTVLLLVLALTALTGCEYEFHPPEAEERAAQADSLYDPAAFDTIEWPGDSARIASGNLVFAEKCRRCHGPLGRGDTEYAREHELEVHSIVEEDWEYADDLPGVRRRIFVGHTEGMRSFGVTTLSPREIDATAYYIIRQLRPELLSGG